MKIRSSHLFTLLKVILLITVFVFIYLKIQHRQNIAGNLISLMRESLYENYLFYLLVIILMPLNWMIEAMKWKLLVRKVESISLYQSFVSVLTGLSLGFISPHGLGDYVGRILQIDNNKRGKLVGSLLLGRLAQLSATLLFGLIGVGYLFGFKIPVLLLFISVVSLIGIIFWLPNISFTLSNRFINKLGYYLDVIKEYSRNQIAIVFGLSLLRYLVFSMQFFIVLYLFIPSMNWFQRAAGISWIFLAKSIIPTFNFLSDLGIREFSAIYFYENLDVPVEPIIAASLMIWLINILIPTICGVPFIFKFKMMAKR